MTTTTTTIAAAARPARARSTRQPKVQPRFKQPRPASPAVAPEPPIWPPEVVLQWDDHPFLGHRDAAAAAERAGRPALAALIRLRQQAADEIQRLMAFLDETEPSGDDHEWDEVTDAEIRACGGYNSLQTGEDDELSGDELEPSLGSPEQHPNPFQDVSYNQARWASGNDDEREGDGCADDREEVSEDEGAEHDGREPSLGWTLDGYAGLTFMPDLEEGAPVRRPQHRTELGAGVQAGTVHCRGFLCGLTQEQEEAMRKRACCYVV